MNLLEFFFIISGIIILILAIDIARKQKFNALHFLVFIGVGGSLLLLAVKPDIVDLIGHVFGVARGADVLVYTSIIFLLYFVLLLLTKHVDNRESITSVIREGAIHHSVSKTIKGKEVFIIRAYNEDQVLEGVINEVLKAGYKNILVVNDGSKDDTRGILEKFGEQIIVLTHSVNRGAGAALETGFEYIRRFGEVEYIITFDADGQHDVADLNNFYKAFDANPEVGAILGSRFIEKTNSNVPFIRKIILFLGKIFTLLISGVNLTDAHNGYRVFKLETIKRVHLTIDTMAYASELIDQIIYNRIKLMEVPVNIRYTEYSMNKGQSSGNAISIAVRMIWSKFFR